MIEVLEQKTEVITNDQIIEKIATLKLYMINEGFGFNSDSVAHIAARVKAKLMGNEKWMTKRIETLFGFYNSEVPRHAKIQKDSPELEYQIEKVNIEDLNLNNEILNWISNQNNISQYQALSESLDAALEIYNNINVR